MDRIIIHVDMDAFYASVEMRDNPELIGRPLIIGSLPHERGVVSTCSYEARKYGVHSAMNIKEAYRLCPNGVYMHPNFEKYKMVSDQLHRIWESYSTELESIALDEAYLDVTETAGNIEKAREYAHLIKDRTLNELGLSCSVGLAYSKTAAKTASEEKKPAGYYEILTPDDFVELIIDRDVNVLYTVGKRAAEKLHAEGIDTVRDLRNRRDDVIRLLGKHGSMLIDMAYGIDDRPVTHYRPEDAKSISREITFQQDVYDYELLQDVLLLISMSVESRARRHGLHGSGVILKITYSDMKSVTRSHTTMFCDDAVSIHRAAVDMLSTLKKRPVRLIGAGVYNLSDRKLRQTTLDELIDDRTDIESQALDQALDDLKSRYRMDFAQGFGTDRVESIHAIAERMRTHKLRWQPA